MGTSHLMLRHVKEWGERAREEEKSERAQSVPALAKVESPRVTIDIS